MNDSIQGLIVDPTSGLLILIKNSCFSFVRPVDALEQLVVADDQTRFFGPELFHDTAILCEDPALAQDVISLMRAVSFVDTLIPIQLMDDYSHSLGRLLSPDHVAKRIVRTILTDPEANVNLTQELSTRLQQVGDVAKALELLLMILELDRGVVAHAPANKSGTSSQGTKAESEMGAPFSSELGVSVVAETLKQLAHTR